MGRNLGRLLCAALLFNALHLSAQSPSLTLDQAQALAAKGSEAIRLKELALQKSRSAITEAASRAWPHVDLQASASYLANPPQGYTISKGEFGTIKFPNPPTFTTYTTIPLPTSDLTIGAQLHNYFSAAATVSQPLFTWGKIANAIDLASLQSDAAGNDLVAQQRDIAREVNRAYFGALLAGKSQVVLQRMRDTAALIVEERQKSFDQGTTNREPVLDAQATLAAVQAQLSGAAQGEATARETLGILTGTDASTIGLDTEFRAALPGIDEPRLQAQALQASTDMAASRTRVSQAQKKLALERGGSILLPDISLGASFSVTGQEDLPYSAAWDWNNATWDWDLIISLGVKTSVFDGLSSAARIAQAEKDAEMAGTALSQAEKLTRLSVRGAVENAMKAEAAAAEKKAKADLAAERSRNAQASFDAGTGTREDMYGAALLAGSAELDWLAAQYAREQALADIARIAGQRL
jgi:outer membrane protein TolC